MNTSRNDFFLASICLTIGLVLGAYSEAIVYFYGRGLLKGEWILPLIFPCLGALGGLLYPMQTGCIKMPSLNTKGEIEPGLIGDLLFGAAGSLAILLVLPGDFNLSPDKIEADELLRSFAVAIIGGFGGRSLVEGLAKNSFSSLEKRTEKTEQKLENLEKQRSIDAHAFALLNQWKSTENDAEIPEPDEIKKTLKQSSNSTQVHAFHVAREIRRQGLEGGSYPGIQNTSYQGRSMIILEALIEEDENEEFHRSYAELAFILKDRKEKESGDLQKALGLLDKAITIRDRRGRRGYHAYEFNRALCRIMLDQEFNKRKPTTSHTRDDIVSDLNTSSQTYRWRAIISQRDNTTINEWLEVSAPLPPAKPEAFGGEPLKAV